MKTIEGPHTDTELQELLDIEAIADEISSKRIDPESFKGERFFDDNEIEQDLERCRKLQDRFKREERNLDPKGREQLERGLAAEYAFRHAIEEYGWLAEDIKMIVASQYDDFIRGIDSIAQIVTGPGRFEHLGFAVDFAASMEDVGEKLRRTFDEIDQGHTASVKYFDSDKTGKLKNFKVPRIIIGAGRETLERLAAYSAEIMNGSGIAESVKSEIARDSFRYVLFGEIEAQLSVCANRLRKVIEKAKGQDKQDIKKRATASLATYENALKTVQGLAQEAEIDMETIHKHVKGDSFANQLGSALSALSLTPIELGLH